MHINGNSAMSTWKTISSWLRDSVHARREWRCRTLRTQARVSARQERIAGWDQAKLAGASILVAGAGGIGGEIVEGLVQKGAGDVHVADFDTVSPTNLNRQKFIPSDLWRNKALRLARGMSFRGFLGTRLSVLVELSFGFFALVLMIISFQVRCGIPPHPAAAKASGGLPAHPARWV